MKRGVLFICFGLALTTIGLGFGILDVFFSLFIFFLGRILWDILFGVVKW